MMMHLWYTVTVASYAFHQRNTLEKHLLKEGVTIEEAQSTAKMSFVDFGMRGVTSLTSADAPIDPFRARRILHWRFCEAFCCDMVLHATLDGDVV